MRKLVALLGIIGVVLAVLLLGASVALPLVGLKIKTTTGFYGLIASMGGGGFLFTALSAYWNNLVAILQAAKPTQLDVKQVPVVQDKNPEKDVPKDTGEDKAENWDLSCWKKMDFKSVNYLTERFDKVGDNDGIALMRKVQDKLFELHHSKKKVKDEGQTTT